MTHTLLSGTIPSMNEPEEDVVLEPEDEVELEGNGEHQISKLRVDLKVCRKEKQEYMDGWQRAKADYVNLLKRGESETKGVELRGKIKTIEALLPAFNALERAKEHGEVPEGFAGIARQLESAFSSLGLEEVGVIGETFDPALHEAFGQDVVDTIETDDTITVVLEKGWRIGDSIVRPAKVRVGHFDQSVTE